jgi:type II secretory pathway pseudopilin PulG
MGSRHKHRSAFTLIELMVVIILIMILAGLSVAFLPTIGDAARQANGAVRLQQWILVAKARAMRDQIPIGVRLVPYTDPVTGFVSVRQCQYIEQPDDFGVIPTSKVGNMWGQAGQKYVIIDMQLSDQVRQGDYLEILGNGLLHGVNGVNAAPSPPNPRGTTQIQLVSPLLYSFNPTKQYRIIRAPRVTGDDILQLPDEVMIDTTTNFRFGNPLPTPNSDGSIDILFSPSGAVISPGTTTDSINLWVRDATYASASATDGEQAIVAVYVRSGLIATHPPAPGNDPYAFVKDGRSSGK